ncbi:MAG: aspartate--tRNA ligase [Bacteroidetes bacterium]|nr:aspartate--tRNA ligase [Bacteroidota bacterium]
MYRTHNCGELRMEHVGVEVRLSGWVARNRNKGFLCFVDLRDRYGITQLTFNEQKNAKLLEQATSLGREFVITATGIVRERESKNPNHSTGDIEIEVSELIILNAAKVPPFIIEDETDGGDDIRMQYRYLDLRRNVVRKNLELRHNLAQEVRKYLDSKGFLEVETPVLIKSTPEGARDFVVPSRMNPGQFYALPQSPQTFKQLLMVSGFDRYFQIVKCFRDEDLRADRQPEFTQIDCEMGFVVREDVIQTFEGLTKHLFHKVLNLELGEIPRITYAEAMEKYGSDKPDIRFEMQFCDLSNIVKGCGFSVFDNAESVLAINVNGAADYTRKQLDELTEFVKKPQIGASGLIYCRCESDGNLKSSVDKFYDSQQLQKWAEACSSKPGDLILVLAGNTAKTRKQLCELRLEMGRKLGLRDPFNFKALWVVDFPLLEQDEETGNWHAMHHPFTSPLLEDLELMNSNPGAVRADAYDLVINGVEIGGGSIRIHNRELQEKMFSLLGFTPESAKAQFGFLMNAFEFGAPPHGGIAFGFDRLCSMFGGSETIRDYIAFPKNNAGRDVMIDAPAALDGAQLKELGIELK